MGALRPRDRDAREKGRWAGPLRRVFDGPVRARDDREVARPLPVLLATVAADPDRPIGVLPVLTAEEEDMLLRDRNATARPISPRRLEQLVAEQAAARPDAVAVEGDGIPLTYGELEANSNQLARHLLERGAGPDTLVTVCMERVPELLVAFLGVLKTGAAYVPADPTYPAARLEAILTDSDAPVLITQEKLLDRLPPRSAAIVCLDRDRAAIADCSAERIDSPGDGESLAYVIYTSGSTGRPKGVEIRHRSVVNLLEAMRERPGLGSDDVVVNVTTSAFDLSVPDLYLPLVCGARLVVTPRDVAHDGRRLAETLEEAGATFMQATPTTWAMLERLRLVRARPQDRVRRRGAASRPRERPAATAELSFGTCTAPPRRPCGRRSTASSPERGLRLSAARSRTRRSTSSTSICSRCPSGSPENS